MIDTKELELLIRAKLKGRQDVEAISKSIKDLSEAIDKQADSAKRGENAYDGLKAALDALRQAQDQLAARAAAFKAFEKQGKDLETIAGKVDLAKAKYDEYSKKLAELANDGKKATDVQVAQQQKLQAAVDRQVNRLDQQRKTYELLGAALKEVGVDVTNLAGEQAKLVQAQLDGATAIGRAQKEMADYSVNVAKARAETKALKDQQAAARSEADLFAAAEKKAADAAAARARAYEDFANKQATRRGDVAAAKRQADEERASIDRQRQLAALRADIEDRTAKAQKDATLSRTADDAERAAKSYSTLARASKDLRPKVVSLREAIDQIRDPSKAVSLTFNDLEQQIGDVSKKISSSVGPVKDYADTLRRLEATQKELSRQSDLVDKYNREVVALRQARAEMVAARTLVAQYAAEVRKGGDAAEQFIKPLGEAESRLKRASAAMREQLLATAGSRDALRQAGINTSQLSQEQQRMINVAKSAASAVQQLTESYRQNGEASAGAAKAKRLFGDEGRTTLSLVQRIRGEVLALAAAYVGVQGAIGLARGSIEAFNTREGVKSQLAISVGTDRKLIDEEYNYVKAQSERIGIEFETAIKNYAKFSAAATVAGSSRKEIRYIFEAFAEVGRVANLTSFEIDGVFKATEQIISKGKIQAEELRRQLGDRLFGAFQIAAKALKSQFPDLDKALAKGQVTSEQLVLIAKEYQKTVSGGLGSAINNLGSYQQRFNNAVNEFKLAIADGGFSDAYLELLKQLTEYLRSEDGKQFAQNISEAFAAVVKSLSFLLEHLTEVKAVAGAVLSLFAVNIFGTLVANSIAAATALTTVTAQLTLIQKAMGVLAAFALGWNFGAYMREKFVEVELFGIAMVRGLLEAFVKIKSGALEIFFELPRYAANAFKAMINLFNNVFATPFIKIMRDIAAALGFDSVAQSLQKVLGAMALSMNMEVSSNTAAVRAQAEADLRAIKSITDEMADDAISRRQKSVSKTVAKATEAPNITPKKPGPSDADIAKRAHEIETITKALESLEAKIDRTQTDTLSKQLEAIDTEYRALAKRIRKLGGEEGKKFLERLETGVSQLKLQITKKFNDKLLDEQNAILNKIEAAEAASGRKQKVDLDARLQAIKKSYEATYRQIEDQRQKLQANGRDTAPAEEAKRRLDAAVLELQNSERIKFNNEELERIQKSVTDTVKARADIITAIKDQEEAGAITRQQAEARVVAEIEKAQPVIDGLVASGLAFADAMGSAMDPAKVEMFRAALIKAQGSGQALKFELNAIGQVVLKSTNAAIDTMVESTMEAAAGAKTWGDVWRSVGRAVSSILSSIIADLIKAQLRAMILKAIMSAFGNGGLPDANGAAALAAVRHSGGVVGPVANRTRNVSPMWFSNAPRYHSGGVVGLAPDEYPAILQKNEEVLAASDPRNVVNSMANGGGAAQRPLRMVLIDDKSRINEATAGAEGEEVWIKHLKRNIATVRTMTKG